MYQFFAKMPFVLLLWFALLSSQAVLAGSADHAVYYSRPKCPLNVLSPHSFLVRLRNGSTTSAHGSLLSTLAVLTVCSGFDQQRIRINYWDPWALIVFASGHGKEAMEVHAVNRYAKVESTRLIEDITAFAGMVKSLASVHDLFDSTCYQKRFVQAIECHPKALLFHSSMGFDFAVLTIDEPFLVEAGTTYPAIFFDNTPDRLLRWLRVMKTEKFSHCDAPVFYNPAEDELRIKYSKDVHVEVYEKGISCAEASCFYRFKTVSEQRGCQNRALSRLNETQQLCVQLPFHEPFTFQHGSLDWYKGTLLVCNGSTYGMTTEVVSMKLYPSHEGYLGTQPYYDTLYMTSFVRVWTFLVSMREKYGPKIPVIHLKNFHWSTEMILIPSTYVETGGYMFNLEDVLKNQPTKIPKVARRLFRTTTREPTPIEFYSIKWDPEERSAQGQGTLLRTNFGFPLSAIIFVILSS